MYKAGVLVGVLLALLCVTSTHTAALCTAPPPLQTGDVVNVAVLMWIADAPQGLFTGSMMDQPYTSDVNYGTVMMQPYQMGVQMYIDRMRARDSQLPLANGANVTVNIVLINLANPLNPILTVNWTESMSDAESGYPYFMYMTGNPDMPLSAAQSGGIFDQVVSHDPVLLQEKFNITQPFTYIVPSAFIFAYSGFTQLINSVEDEKKAVIVHPFLPSHEDFVCDGKPIEVSLTPDCLSPQFNRSRKQGARRYETLFGTLFDSTGNTIAALDSYHVLGVESIAIISVADEGTTFATWAADVCRTSAEQLNMQVKAQVNMVKGTCPTLTSCPGANCTIPPNCPPLDQKHAYQGFVWPGNKTAMHMALEFQSLNPQALVILLGNPSASWSISRLFAAMKEIDWTPQMISYGGTDSSIDLFIDSPDHKLYSWGTLPWHPSLRGPIYKTRVTETNFELLPSVQGADAPAVFWDAVMREYGPGGSKAGPDGAPHPMWMPSSFSVGHIVGWSVMIQVQKLIEASMTLEVPSILIAAKSISTPSAYHQLQFDLYGRTSRVNEMLVQYVPGGSYELLQPYNVGVKPVFPLPTWKERVFNPTFYSEPNERVMLALTCLCLLLCGALIVFVVVNYRTALIRAATPSFSLVIIFGAMLMLSSNFFATLHVNDGHCAASTWLLTLGFSTTFGALFIKTFRIWRIFGDKRLTVLKMKDGELVLYLSLFVLVDIVINAVWAGMMGMGARLVVVDPVRPVYNYYTCDYTDSIALVYTHVAIKGALLLIGVALTYAVRNTPSAFNESTLIGLCLYNVSLVICFVLPILSANLGGRHTSYLIRAFAIMFVVLVTLGLLYVPKIMLLSGKPVPGGLLNTAPGHKGNTAAVQPLRSTAMNGAKKSDDGTNVKSSQGGGESALMSADRPRAPVSPVGAAASSQRNKWTTGTLAVDAASPTSPQQLRSSSPSLVPPNDRRLAPAASSVDGTEAPPVSEAAPADDVRHFAMPGALNVSETPDGREQEAGLLASTAGVSVDGSAATSHYRVAVREEADA